MGNYKNHDYNCLECNDKISEAVYDYSTENYGQSLCRTCQNWLHSIIKKTSVTQESINLYFELKKFGVPALLEVSDGYKTVDISVPDAKVHIEVDGKHHHHNAGQALADLKRTYHSLKDGYVTLRIPNSLTKNNIEVAAKYITDLLIENKLRINNSEMHTGFCIRCRVKIQLNPERPYCYDCFSSWVEYENYTYEERACHLCGRDNRTSMSKPLCYECYT